MNEEMSESQTIQKIISLYNRDLLSIWVTSFFSVFRQEHKILIEFLKYAEDQL